MSYDDDSPRVVPQMCLSKRLTDISRTTISAISRATNGHQQCTLEHTQQDHHAVLPSNPSNYLEPRA